MDRLLQPDRTTRTATSLIAVLALTFFCSIATGVFWHAVSFIAKHRYGFDQTRNLTMYAMMGATYIVFAYKAGAVTRMLRQVMTPRTMVVCLLVVQALACIGPVAFAGEWTIWLAFGVSTVCLALIWPLIESYIGAGRHGPAMRSSVGWFNMIWMPAVALPLLLMPPLLERHGEWVLAAQAAVYLAAIVPLWWFAPRPGFHDPETATQHVPAEYRLLLRCARVLLPVSYVLMAAIAPILPYRFEAIRDHQAALEQAPMSVEAETPVAATWMVVRFLAVVVMWRLGFWHGRWGTLLLATIAMTIGFALVVLAMSIPVMMTGFAIFGAGLGMVYYAALYYALAVGHAEVDAGGTHEALIGIGYTVGPLAGLAGTAIGSTQEVDGGAAIVAIVWFIVAFGAVVAIQPYIVALRIRRRKREADDAG
jgi:hypothetical protein